jgi:hypothetical protein
MRVAALLIGLAGGCGLLSAATLEKLSLEEMAAKSTEIVLGRVISKSYQQRGSVIYTVARVQVSERWKGSSKDIVEVCVAGGVMNGMRQVFPGSPFFRDGHEYLFFLWTGRSGATQVIGLSQGLFDLRSNAKGETQVYRGASTETMLDKTGRRISDDPTEMSLDEMRGYVKRVLGGVRE